MIGSKRRNREWISILAATLAPAAGAGPIQAGPNLDLGAATYLGSAAADSGRAVDLAPDGSIWYAGSLEGNNLGLTPSNLLGGGSGVLIQLDGEGRKALSISRLPSAVEDMEINRTNGKIAVAGAFGIAYLDAEGKTVLWSKTLGPGGGGNLGPGRRVSVGTEGTVAALFNKRVSAFDEAGNAVADFAVEGSWVNDVAMHGPGKLIIVAGFTQKDGGGCSQLQVPWIRAYDASGTLRWKNYDWTHAEAYAGNSSCADSRGYLITIGRDGMLYYAGESAGGNTIYRYSPKSLQQPGQLIGYDSYTEAYNTGSNHIAFFARFQPADGAIMAGQLLLARLPNTQGNTIRPRGLAADEVGRVYVTGKTACCIQNRDQLTVDGKPVGPGDAFILVSAPDFKSRLAWTTFAGGDTTEKNNRYEIGAVAAGMGKAVLAATAIGTMMVKHAIQPQGNGLSSGFSDGYLAVWPVAVGSPLIPMRKRNLSGPIIAGMVDRYSVIRFSFGVGSSDALGRLSTWRAD